MVSITIATTTTANARMHQRRSRSPITVILLLQLLLQTGPIAAWLLLVPSTTTKTVGRVAPPNVQCQWRFGSSAQQHQQRHAARCYPWALSAVGTRRDDNNSNNNSEEPDWNSNDPWRILGVPRGTATAADIKRAYRRLALRYHPDVVLGAANENNDSSTTGATGGDQQQQKQQQLKQQQDKNNKKAVASERFAKINWAYQVASGKQKDSSTASRSSSTTTSSSGWEPPHRRRPGA